VGDVAVQNGVILTIAPGVRVEFQDHHRLEVDGTLLAEGTPRERILFTTDEPQAFAVDRSLTGCWNGIWFENTPSTNAPSRLAWCIIEHSKSVGRQGGLHDYGGGAISVAGFSELTVENCVLRHNVAEYGGAFFLYRQANARILGNLIADNHALKDAGAIYCAYSYPEIAGNTIVGNRIHNPNLSYSETCAVMSYIAKPRLANNVIWGNDPIVHSFHEQIRNEKAYYTRYNDVERYAGAGQGGNITADPLFVVPEWRLGAGSPCIDAGDNAAVSGRAARDLDGLPRRVDDPLTPDTGSGQPPLVDMGAYEYRSAGRR